MNTKNYKVPASADGYQLSVVVAEPETPAKGIMLIVHGMCEHKGRYMPFIDFLSANGYIAVCYDHRGHGETAPSESELGYFGKGGWRALVEDIRVMADWAKEKFPGLPLHLLGHRMGSMAVRAFTKRYDDRINSLFVCGSPSYNPAVGIGKFLARCYGWLCGWHYRPRLLQRMSLGSYNKVFKNEGSPNAWICTDTEIQKKHREDKFCSFVFTANGFLSLFGLMSDCYSPKGWKVSKPMLPVCFLTGSDDPCHIDDAHHKRSVEFMRKVGYRKVESIMYPGMRHEVLLEKGKEKVFEDVLKRLP